MPPKKKTRRERLVELIRKRQIPTVPSSPVVVRLDEAGLDRFLAEHEKHKDAGASSERAISITLLPESWIYVLTCLSSAARIPLTSTPLQTATLERIAAEIERQMGLLNPPPSATSPGVQLKEE